MAVGFEQGSRTSFSFRSETARVNLSHRYGDTWSLQGEYAIQRNDIFEDRINPVDQPLIDRLFPQVRIGSVSASAVRSTRDDAFNPKRGHARRAATESWRCGRSGRRSGSPRRSCRASSTVSSRPARGSSSPPARASAWRRLPREVPRVTPTASPILGPDGEPVDADGARPAGERALLRRRRHDGPRVRARPARRARHVRPRRHADWRPRGSHPERRGPPGALEGPRRRRVPRCRQRVLDREQRCRSGTLRAGDRVRPPIRLAGRAVPDRLRVQARDASHVRPESRRPVRAAHQHRAGVLKK
ncbi:MAG: outer membrane protein assembly factor [Ignavibacteriales bacterium]|nr:outer membrane protein assembly factor [Ignavibacteriales bacterium]